jgi:quercetin dioxygenase-like cupin family protein
MSFLKPAVKRWTWEKTLSEPAILRSLEEEGFRSTRWINDPGYVYAPHTHEYDKVILVMRGSITFNLSKTSEEYKLQPGDRLELPAGFEHEATVGPQGVLCLEGKAYPE